VPEAAGVPLQRLERAEQSTLWITASEVGASATCVGVAPACKELRSGPNKSEREPTSARSTNYGSGHLIPAFHGTGRTFSLLPSHPLDARVSQHRRPLGLVLERQSSQAKDGFVESKKVSIVFRAELTAGDERAARLSPKTRTPPESAALGGGFSGTLIWWCTKGPAMVALWKRGQDKVAAVV